jgi:hypothetical protein
MAIRSQVSGSQPDGAGHRADFSPVGGIRPKPSQVRREFTLPPAGPDGLRYQVLVVLPAGMGPGLEFYPQPLRC